MLAAVVLWSAAGGLRAADKDGEKEKASSWPFCPVTEPAVPAVARPDRVATPVDNFILSKLDDAGLEPNPPAPPLVLLRRVTFDLTGLAPTPEECRAFLEDTAKGAYERVVERLLNSPHYGERWAQHWLDVVRFAESEGFKLDLSRQEAYRYRDYVIRSFNDDVPYDRFVREQLAGDELDPDNPSALIATGYYRLHAEESNGANYTEIRQEILNDITDTFGASFLGLTVGCARCHDHKFDPILHTDYYRLQAFFAPLIQHDDLSLAAPELRRRAAAQQAVWENKTAAIRAAMDAVLDPVRTRISEEIIETYDPATQAALRVAPEKRTAVQQQLVSLASKQIQRRCRKAHVKLSPAARARFEDLRRQLAAFDADKPLPLPGVMAVTDVTGEPPVTRRLAAGDYLKPREAVAPGFPEFLDPTAPAIIPPARRPGSTGRRSALAEWLCRPEHPLTRRVIVNRLWDHHFGRGLVPTPNDFGANGGPASHPELLDFLSAALLRNGWRLKSIHRMIVCSNAYRQSSAAGLNPTRAKAAKGDPENALLWHARVKRRDAEAIRDASLQFSGRLNPRMFGPSACPELPAPLQDSRYAWDPDPRPEDRDRRSVYVLMKRNMQYPLFEAFDQPDRLASCPVRSITITAPQALMMLNGRFSLAQARAAAGRLLSKHGADTGAVIRDAYRGAFARSPDVDEFQAARRFLDGEARVVGKVLPPDALPDPLPPGVSPEAGAALVDLTHALMNASEFYFIE